MSGYVLHPEAYIDLDDIWGFIAEDSLDAADRYARTFTEPLAISSAFLIRGTGGPTLPCDLCGS